MTPFIAEQIIRERKKSLEDGQKKYRAYFVNTVLYVRYQEHVNTILETEGYTDAIVTA